MSPQNRFRRMELDFAAGFKRKMSALGTGAAALFKNIFSAGKQRFTIMLIPHSEKKVFNLQINTFAMIFLTLLLCLLIGGFFFLATFFSGSSRLISDKNEALDNTTASLEVLQEETRSLSDDFRDWVAGFEAFKKRLNISGGEDLNTTPGTGDLSSLFVDEVSAGELPEVSEIQKMRESLKESVEFMTEIADTLEQQDKILEDLPSLWPVEKGYGMVTLEWGPAIHPIHNTWYMHNGLDIAYRFKGLEVVASARGKVEKVDYKEETQGIYVRLDHNYGFKTLYAHLDQAIVKSGDEVEKGQVIGYMGNTGRSTGTHLHFEIIFGENTVDPMRYLLIDNPNAPRWKGNRGAYSLY